MEDDKPRHDGESPIEEDIEHICHELGLLSSAEQCRNLAAYAELLQHWNATYNLSAVRGQADILTHHLADCLAFIAPLQRQCDAGTILDVGSGGGLPGVVIAIMLPAMQVTCLDAVAKKAAFVRQVAGTIPVENLKASHGRVEQGASARFDVITSRAFASLTTFVQASRHRLVPNGIWIAMKGKRPTDEIAALPAWAQVFHVEPLKVPGLSADRCLVWIKQTAVLAV